MGLSSKYNRTNGLLMPPPADTSETVLAFARAVVAKMDFSQEPALDMRKDASLNAGYDYTA